jgi:hypothetical protein
MTDGAKTNTRRQGAKNTLMKTHKDALCNAVPFCVLAVDFDFPPTSEYTVL